MKIPPTKTLYHIFFMHEKALCFIMDYMCVFSAVVATDQPTRIMTKEMVCKQDYHGNSSSLR